MSFKDALDSIGEGIKYLSQLNVRTFTGDISATAAGLDSNTAAGHIRDMHGPHRIPTLLKRVDQLSHIKSDGAS